VSPNTELLRPLVDRSTAAQQRYAAVGRRALRSHLAAVAGDDSAAAAARALRERRVTPAVVRFWLLEDLLADLRLEAAAREGYGELAELFDAVDEERRAECKRGIERADAESAERASAGRWS
jgi:hypothetical protein